jgi:uncharacterized protein YgbK (DUF1537 family)
VPTEPRGLSALARDVRRELARSGRVLVVLDDDPTGSQSVAGVPVLTTWEDADVDWALGRHTAAIYVLTNARSLPAREAADLNREIVARFLTRAAAADVRPTFVSRSDSTLRGHFPLETDTIRETLEANGHRGVDGTILLLAFPDAGRVTIGSTHYVRGQDTLLPVSETEFAQDATFGFATSYLPAYVEQKSAGRVAQGDVVRVTLADLRGDGRAARRMLTRARDNAHIVVDAEDDRDLLLFAAALNDVEAAGKSFIYRSGPQFVRARIGQEAPAPMRPRPPCDHSDAHGLVVVGSHTAVTTRQLQTLRRSRELAEIELDVARTLDDRGGGYLDELAEALADSVRRSDTVISTSRALVRGRDEDDSLDIARRVSEALVRVVRGACARVQPCFVVAKGGITASDVAKHALGIRRAMVEGPVLDGIVSVWQPADGIMRGRPFVVFAGNVGDDDSLVEVIDKLGGHRPAGVDVAAGG